MCYSNFNDIIFNLKVRPGVSKNSVCPWVTSAGWSRMKSQLNLWIKKKKKNDRESWDDWQSRAGRNSQILMFSSGTLVCPLVCILRHQVNHVLLTGGGRYLYDHFKEEESDWEVKTTDLGSHSSYVVEQDSNLESSHTRPSLGLPHLPPRCLLCHSRDARMIKKIRMNKSSHEAYLGEKDYV